MAGKTCQIRTRERARSSDCGLAVGTCQFGSASGDSDRQLVIETALRHTGQKPIRHADNCGDARMSIRLVQRITARGICLCWARAPMKTRGHTLVEMMFGLMIAMVIMGAAYTVTVGHDRASTASNQTAEMQQGARIAMEFITHDLKMAGYGGPTGIGGCGTGILPGDNNPGGADTGPDWVSMVVPTPLASLAAAAGSGGSTVLLTAGAVASINAAYAPEVFGVTSWISIGGAYATQVTSLATDTLTVSPATPLTSLYPVGTAVTWLRCIRYTIGTTTAACSGTAPCLLRGVTGGSMVPIAEGIEDLQLAYACDGCNGTVPDGIVDDLDGSGNFSDGDFVSNSAWSTPPMTPDTIRLVRVNIVARQSGIDQRQGDAGGPLSQTTGVISVEDHNPSNDAGFSLSTYQQRRRRLLTRTVQLRNIGL